MGTLFPPPPLVVLFLPPLLWAECPTVFLGKKTEKAFRATQVSGNAMRTVVLQGGRRRALDPHRVRRLSMVQLGLRWLRYAVEHGLYDRLKLGRRYLYPK